MITRKYFIAAKCQDSTGYCFVSKIFGYRTFLDCSEEAYSENAKELKKELMAIRPNGQFQVTAFNRI